MKCTRNLQCRRPRISDFNLQHDRPEMFVSAQFGPPWVAVIWHVIWSSYLTAALLVELLVYTESEVKPTWLIYSTNWSYLLVILTAFIEFLSRLVALVARRGIVTGQGRTMLWYLKVQWVFLNTNNVITILVTVLYNTVLTPDISFVCLNRVISPSMYVLLTNTVINVHPVKVFHFYQPAGFAILYVITASIVQRISNNIPRDTLIFRSDKTLETVIVSVCVVVIVIPLIHLLFYSLYKLRIFMCNKHFSAQHSGSTCSLQAIQRDTTTTDVVLEDDPRVTYIDLKPDVKDDIALHLGAADSSSPTNVSAQRRINKSETDLRDYRSRNGFYCDFAPASDIFHHTELEYSDPAECSHSRASGDTSKGSQIILVKACNGYVNEAFEDDCSSSEDDVKSDASSDYLSEYINQEIVPYM